MVCDRPYWQPLRLFASWPSALAALGAFLVTVWAIYGCTADPFYGITTLARGVAELAAFADTGEPSFFLGHINLHGSPAFFPVLLLVKSPLPFLAAIAIGAAVLLRWHRRDWRRMAPLVGAAAIVASVIPSTINIGLRHILPAFPLLAIVAAIGLGAAACTTAALGPCCRGRAAAALADRRGGRRRAGLSELFQPARGG